MQRITSTILAAVLTLALVACGGGSGGDGAQQPELPGTLRALALQGQPAPGTSGMFDAFDSHPVMDAAGGGFCAFVAHTTDAANPEVLYVAQPDDVPTIVPVFVSGEDLPPGSVSDGEIGAFDRVWMLADGTVLAHVGVEMDSGSRSFAVISARVSGGAALDKTTLITHMDDLTGAGGSGALDFIDESTAMAATDGTFWFFGDDSGTGLTGLWSVKKDGTGLTSRAQVGSLLDNMGKTATSIDAFGIDAAGAYYVYAAGASTGGASLIVKTAVITALNQEFWKTGAGFGGAEPGTAVTPWKGGRILVFPDGVVIWVTQGSQPGLDDVLMLYRPDLLNPTQQGTFRVLMRSGDTATSTGMGTHAVIDLLHVGASCIFPQVESTILGSTNGVTTGTFIVINEQGGSLLDSSNLIESGGSTVAASTIDLRNGSQPYDETSANGSFLFAQAFAGTSALFWILRDTNTTFPVAAEGGAAPGGDTFGPFEPTSGHTVANDNALFRANLTTAGSGLFRHGP